MTACGLWGLDLPQRLKVPDLAAPMLQAVSLEVNIDAAHPVLVAAHAYYGLVAIHPFADGNGRTARLLMNLLLIRAGFPPALLPVTERSAYYAALEEANSSNLEPFEGLIVQRVKVALLDLLALVDEGEDQ